MLGECQHCPLVSQRVEDQVNVRKEELGELFAEMPSLGEEEEGADFSIEKRFLDLLEPLGRRKKQLESSRAKLQISRDLEDETVRVSQTSTPQRPRQRLPSGLLAAAQGSSWQQMSGHLTPLSHRIVAMLKHKSKASAF